MADSRRRLYLAGPMSGYAEHNFPLFNRVAARLRDLSFDVFNPAENIGGDTSKPRAFYMRIDIPALLECDEVVLLPGWRESRGASLEAWLALDLGMPMHEYHWLGDTVSLHPVSDLEPGALPFDHKHKPVADSSLSEARQV